MGIFRREEKRVISELKCGCTSRGWGLPMSKYNQNLRRYHLPAHECGACDTFKGGGMLEDGLHITARMLSTLEEEAICDEYRRMRSLLPEICIHDLMAYLKEMTGLYKQGGPFICEYWRIFCYWEMMFGYTPPVDLAQLKPDVEET